MMHSLGGNRNYRSFSD